MTQTEFPHTGSSEELDSIQLESLVALANGKQRISVFTGAGISTESGIPDYRGPNGVWATQKPPTAGDFATNPETRRAYWLSRKERFPELISKKPNIGHIAIARMYEASFVSAVITQNIDGLHQDAGIPAEDVIELHGSARTVRCLDCGHTWDGMDIQMRQDQGEEVPTCEICGGPLRASTVLFGEALSPGVLDRAIAVTEASDLMLVVGSSLIVQPAAKVPLIAVRRGRPLAIVNLSETPLDRFASVIVRSSSGKTLAALADRVLDQEPGT